MKINLYILKKLKIKTWIKYWIYKSKEFIQYKISEITSGTSFTLQNTIEREFKLFDLKGNTTQESIAYIDTGSWEQGTINGTTGQNAVADSHIRTADYIPVFPNVLYNISRTISTSYMAFRFYDSNKQFLGTQGTEGMVTTNQSDNRMYNGISSMTMTIINTNVAYMRMFDASNNLSTVYTISTTAPNPSYPQDINNVTGDNTIVIQNKNLYLSSENSANYLRLYFDYKNAQQTITLSYTTPIALNNIAILFRIDDVNTGERVANITAIANSKASVTIAFGDRLYNLIKNANNNVAIYLYSAGLNFENPTDAMIENGSTATDYVAHEEQTLTFTLEEDQKLYAGDYLSDDGIHHVMGEDTVSGTTATLSDAKENGSYYCTQSTAGTLSGQVATFDSEVTDATIQYELAEEVIESYTDTQQTEWEAIKKAKSYNEQTNISQTNNDLPFIINLQYWEVASDE